MGLMIGIDVAEGYTNKDLSARLNQAGLLSLTAGQDCGCCRRLTITKEEMDKGLAVLRAALENL